MLQDNLKTLIQSLLGHLFQPAGFSLLCHQDTQVISCVWFPLNKMKAINFIICVIRLENFECRVRFTDSR